MRKIRTRGATRSQSYTSNVHRIFKKSKHGLITWFNKCSLKLLMYLKQTFGSKLVHESFKELITFLKSCEACYIIYSISLSNIYRL